MTDPLDETIGMWFQRATALQDHRPLIEPYRTSAEVEDRLLEGDEKMLAMRAAAVAWCHAGTDVALVLLETAALLALHGDGASGDIEADADDLRAIVEHLSLWVEALDERVADERVLEAAEDAAGLGSGDLGESPPAWYASAAQSRSHTQALREERLARRADLIDVARAGRQSRLAARIRDLRREVQGLRRAGTQPEKNS